MAKVNTEAKRTYADKVRVYKQEIDQILQRERSLLQVVEKNDDNKNFQLFTLAEDRLNLAAHYLLLNRISVAMLGIKNEAFLNDARKSCYESIIYLEKIVTDYIDVPFSELEEFWDSMGDITDPQRYLLLKKLGFTIDSVIEEFGQNSKWKWSFVDLNGRYASVYKNLINFKTIVAGMDPRVEDYQIRTKMIAQVKQLLNKSADDFRLKYEISTNRSDDFRNAIRYLSALRRIHVLFGEASEAEEVKKKAELWKHKMETDERNRKDTEG